MLQTSIHILGFLQTFYLLSKGDILWADPLNSSNGAYIDWNISGTVDPPYIGTTPEAFCPSTNGCWRFAETSSAYYISSSVHYYNLSITYGVSASTDTDTCHIYYSIDGTTDWTPIQPSSTSTTSSTIALPSNTSNNIGVGIKITSLSLPNQQNYCYFSDITFEGHQLPKSTQKPPNLFENIQNQIMSLPMHIIIVIAVVAVLFVVFIIVLCCKLCNKKSVQNTKKQMDQTLNVDIMSDDNIAPNVYGNDGEARNDIPKKVNASSEPVMSTSNGIANIDTPTKVSEEPEKEAVDIIVADDNEADSSRESVTGDDSLLRKQRQYEFEEECNIHDGDANTPLPDFPTNLNMGVTTESVVFEHIMSDMKRSQLKLRTENNTDVNEVNDD